MAALGKLMMHYGNGTKATLLLASTLTAMSGAAITPALPEMARAFADNPNAEFWSKMALTTPALIIAVLSPIAGRIVDRFGRLRLLTISLLLFAFGGGWGYFAANLTQIILGRAVFGVGVAGIMTVATTLMADYFSGAEREKLMGFQGAAVAGGAMVFVGGAGLLTDISWRLPFLTYLLALPILALALIYLTEPEIASKEKEPGAGRVRFSPVQLLIFFTAMLLFLLFYLIPVHLPFFLKSIGYEKNALTGYAIAALTGSATTMAMLYRYIRKYLSYQTVFAFVFFALGVGMVILATSTSFPQVMIGMFVTGLGGGLYMPNANVWLMTVTAPEIRGTAVGVLSTFLFAGQFLSPVVSEPLKGTFDLSTIFMGAGLLHFVFAAAYLVYARRLATKNAAP